MFGYPKEAVSDKGPPYQSDLLKLYFEFLNIQHRKITTHYPPANGMVQKFMKSYQKPSRQKLERQSP